MLCLCKMSRSVKFVSKTSFSSVLSSFTDGSIFKNHLLFSKEASFQIILFFDELKTVDAIGFSRGKHKLGAFYYKITDDLSDSHPKLDDIMVAILLKDIAY